MTPEELEAIEALASKATKVKTSEPKFNSIPSRERLVELFEYDSMTGNLIWRERKAADGYRPHTIIPWNVKNSGKIAGNVCARGYRTIYIDGASYRAHRVVWVYHNGELPDLYIDHVNHNRCDNRIENLRLVTKLGNARNTRLQQNNKSGRGGVHWHNASSKWEAQISHGGKNIYLGVFAKLDDAIAARDEADEQYGYHSNHGKRSTPTPPVQS